MLMSMSGIIGPSTELIISLDSVRRVVGFRKHGSMRARKFKVHFNRINMQRGLPTVWTIHMSDRCIPATQVVMDIPVVTHYDPVHDQPRAWFQGNGFVHHLGQNRYRIDGKKPQV